MVEEKAHGTRDIVIDFVGRVKLPQPIKKQTKRNDITGGYIFYFDYYWEETGNSPVIQFEIYSKTWA